MIFSAHCVTPKLTPSTAPVLTPLPIVLGTINRMQIFFPPGVNALAHIRILWGLYQVFPSNEAGDFAAGGVMVDWAEDIVIDRDPAELVCQTTNEDDTYPHTITVHVVMTPSAAQSNIARVLAALTGGS